MGLSEDGCQGLRVLSFSFFQAVRELTETHTYRIFHYDLHFAFLKQMFCHLYLL